MRSLHIVTSCRIYVCTEGLAVSCVHHHKIVWSARWRVCAQSLQFTAVHSTNSDAGWSRVL